MFRHYFHQIFRSFKKFKSTFLINLIGLSTGLACSFLIYLWVTDELSVDKYSKNDDRLYLAMENRIRDGGIWTSRTTSGPLAEGLVADMPEVEYAAIGTTVQNGTLSVDNFIVRSVGKYADKDYFKIFATEMIEGDPSNALVDKTSIVISESLALKLFHTTKGIIGKAIAVDLGQPSYVSGVFKDLPINATDPYEYVRSWNSFKEGKDWLMGWGNTGLRTFVLLKPGVNIRAFNKKIANFVKVKTGFEIRHRTLFLEKFSNFYLYGKYENGKVAGGRIDYVKLFSMIAVFILTIACINFMNLSTARASARIKEVGIKKALGAGRRVLILQYLGEALFMAFVSLIFASLIVLLFLPHFNDLTGKHLSINPDPRIILIALSVTIVTGLLSGSYPALYLSGFNPVMVLKGKLTASFGELWARKGLVVLQFTLSIIFIVGVVVVYQQIKFVQSANLGYDRDHIIYFPREGKLGRGNLETFLAQTKNIPGVLNASSIGHGLKGHNSGTSGVHWEGKDPEDKTEFENISVDFDMIETLGLTMVSGRAFSKEFTGDTARIIFNETGIKYMGLKDPLGKTIRLWDQNMQIVGVVKDFNYESLHNSMKPVFLRLEPEDTWNVMVKVKGGTEKEVVAGLHEIYKTFNPGFTLDYRFLDEDYQILYASELRVASLSKYFAGLAILISCLGLFGLASFTAERRSKEIGIRKVLGSSVGQIVYLLSAEFSKIVFTSIIIALPVSYWLTKSWLSEFAFRITPSWWYFASAGIAALVIAWLTVGIQAFKAARVNPTKALNEQ